MPTTLDPLVERSERFALDHPRLPHPAEPQIADHRPFGLRFATAPTPVDDRPLPAWTLSVDTQIAHTPDGTRWYMTVAKLPMSTTGESSDGGPNTGGEEWRPDYLADVDGPA